MSIKYNKNSSNREYNDLLNQLGVDKKKQTDMLFKTLKIQHNKYCLMCH